MITTHPPHKPLKAAILLAAGKGTRFAAGLAQEKKSISKQFHLLHGKPLIRHAAEALKKYVDIIQPVGDDPLLEEALQGLDLLPAVPGGKERQESVCAGLDALATYKTRPDIVLIHDGARPCLPHRMMCDLLKTLEEAPGVIPALMVSDTLKKVENGIITHTVPREGLWRAQTPQGFSFPLLHHLHHMSQEPHTDDSSLLEKAGYSVRIILGSEDNIKLTHIEDLQRLENALKNQHLSLEKSV